MFYYGMRVRGFSIGAQPYGVCGCVDVETDKYYDIIYYDRPLMEDEMEAYSLDDVKFGNYAIKVDGSFQPEADYENLQDAIEVIREWKEFDKEHGEYAEYKIVML